MMDESTWETKAGMVEASINDSVEGYLVDYKGLRGYCVDYGYHIPTRL